MKLDPNALTKALQSTIVPDLRAATATGTAVDTDGYQDGYALVLVAAGDLDDTATLSLQVQEDDNSGFSSATNVGSAIPVLTVTTPADNTWITAGYIRLYGRERYLRVVGTYGGSGNVTYGVAIQLINPQATEFQGTDITLIA